MTEELRIKWYDSMGPDEVARHYMGVSDDLIVVILMDGYRERDRSSRVVCTDLDALKRVVNVVGGGELKEDLHGRPYAVLTGEPRQNAMDFIPIMPANEIDEFLNDFFKPTPMNNVNVTVVKPGESMLDVPFIKDAPIGNVERAEEIVLADYPGHTDQQTVLFLRKDEGKLYGSEVQYDVIKALAAKMESDVFSNCIIACKNEQGVYEIKGVPVSDGYHTHDELYEHRHRLYITLLTIIHKAYKGVYIWKSRKHSNGAEWDGWFLLGIGTNVGEQLTYHLPTSYWEETSFVRELPMAPEWDGHKSEDVLDRLIKLARQI
jgi:hypothetical protein